MCGRHRRTTREEEPARIHSIPIPKQPDLPVSYNIAPSQNVLMIRFDPEIKERTLDQLRWGLIPHWAKDQKIAYQAINARAETVDRTPSSGLTNAIFIVGPTLILWLGHCNKLSRNCHLMFATPTHYARHLLKGR
jgi:hypothetical protein